ncbi:biotin--[acetyl-CoA-carboxylase] ligase [Rhodobacterales bacterium 52_120_T64]|mgnify:FL=1|nr:biotin--[acetyl-CoA-carboxylase] ligase [Rhodobacterales bacterium 52_120_T64]
MDSWPEGVGREVFQTLDSTNAEAIRRASKGESGPAWFLTLEQTQSRARRGRPWDSGKGNFSASLLIRPKGGPEHAALRSFIAALALRDALVEVCGREDIFSLKWPNDVLLNNRKLAGILLESGIDASGSYLCIGIGVNLSNEPDSSFIEDGAFAPISLRSVIGVKIDPENFLTLLAMAFDRWETQFQQYGFEPIRNEWLNHATRLGEVITAKLMGRTEVGTFETVDEAGAIVLRTSKGLLHLPAAEIYFGTEG